MAAASDWEEEEGLVAVLELDDVEGDVMLEDLKVVATGDLLVETVMRLLNSMVVVL